MWQYSFLTESKIIGGIPARQIKNHLYTGRMQLEIPGHDFEGYIFDCDGTLADTMPLHYEAWIAALEEQRAATYFPEKVFYSLGGVASDVIISRLNRQHGLLMDPEAVSHRKEALFLERLKSVERLHPVTDFALEVSRSRPVAVVSGGFKNIVLDTLKLIEMEAVFPIVITPEDVTHGKPAPDMFLLAAEKMGVAPNRCLVFEDGPSGIEGARAAGMQTVFVPSHDHGPEA